MDASDKTSRLEVLLDLGEDISKDEIERSRRATDLLIGKSVTAVRVLWHKHCELLIEFTDGSRLRVDHFNNDHDISILTNEDE